MLRQAYVNKWVYQDIKSLPKKKTITVATISNGPNGIWALIVLFLRAKGMAKIVPIREAMNIKRTELTGPPTIIQRQIPSLTSPPPIHLPPDS